MTPDGTDKYRQWDAAYVLGSLGRLERREFEQHLAGCAGCRAAVAEIAGLPSLLDALTPQEAQAVGPAAAPAVTAELPPGLAEKVRRRRQRARLAVAGLVLGASAASGAGAAMIAALPERPAVQSQPAPVTELSFTPVVDNALAAKGSITGQAWGTRIDWECSYALSADGYPSRTGPGDAGASEVYSLAVVDSRGVTTQVASWSAGPGTVVTPTATTSIRAADIRQVEIRGSTGTVLLTARP